MLSRASFKIAKDYAYTVKIKGRSNKKPQLEALQAENNDSSS
jgi:hypothetical protein